MFSNQDENIIVGLFQICMLFLILILQSNDMKSLFTGDLFLLLGKAIEQFLEAMGPLVRKS